MKSLSVQKYRMVSWLRAAKNVVAPLCVVMMGLLATGAYAEIDQKQYQEDLRNIAQHVRTPGSEGYRKAAGYLEEQFKLLGDRVEVRRQDYQVMAPVTRLATLKWEGGQGRIDPFWPAGARLNTTPAEGITGKLVYCGNGRVEEIPPRDINGNIAVIEASAGAQWQQVAAFGARAILVLGNDQTSHVDLRSHDVLLPVNLPRFYVADRKLAQQLREEKISQATLTSLGNWQSCTASNYYVLVRASKEISAPNPADVLSIPYDSGGLVPDLAYSASQAAQTAAGLALLRDIAAHPVSRPVLFCFNGAESIQMLGNRQFLMTFADDPAAWGKEAVSLRDQEQAAGRDYQRLVSARQNMASLNPTGDRGALEWVVDIIEMEIVSAQDRLFRLRQLPREAFGAREKQQVEDVLRQQALLNRLRSAFTRHVADLRNPEISGIAGQYMDKAIARIGGENAQGGLLASYQARVKILEERIELNKWLAERTGSLRKEYDGPRPRLVEMTLSLDLSDSGVRFGPMYRGEFRQGGNVSHIQDYRDWFNRLRDKAGKQDAADGMNWFEGIRNILDTESFSGTESPASWAAGPLPIGTEMCMYWGVPAFSLVTLDDLRLRRDTPEDTLAQLNTPVIIRQLEAVMVLVRHAWDDPSFKGPRDLRSTHSSISGQVVSPSPWSPVPNLPREGFVGMWSLVTSPRRVPILRPVPYAMGVRRAEMVNTDEIGQWRIEGLPYVTNDKFGRMVNVQLYGIVPDTGVIEAASDLGRQSASMAQTYDIGTENDTMHNLVFNCREVSLFGLSDPRFMQDLGEVVPLDARRNAEPQRYNVGVSRQMMAGFFERDTRLYLLFRYGRIGNRLVLINTGGSAGQLHVDKTGSVSAQGYTLDELGSMGLLSLVTSRDFFNLDEGRLREYRKAGVSSSLIDDLHSKAGEAIGHAESGLNNNDSPALLRHANGAWASEARVYQAAQSMANDVIYAAIFLLLLCVPFSFCMERLLIGTPNVYKQIAGTSGIFALMALGLCAFHPAFKITSSPLIIILAFAIIFMSIVVISVVYSKFDTELKNIRSGRGMPASTNLARASVLMSAAMLGIANMRRRKFRTALTSITIVLITFAVLCFTSATRYLDTITLPTGASSDVSGILLRQRGWRPMPESAVDNLRSVLGSRAIVTRRWNINASDPKETIHIVAAGKPGAPARVFAAQAVLGLSPGESSLSSVGQVIGAGKFARLERGEQNIIYFSRGIAEQLKVKEGDKVKLGGIDLEVAGIYDGGEFDRRAQLMSGDPISPLKYTLGMLDSGGRKLDEQLADSLDLDADSGAAEVTSEYEHLSASQFVIVPDGISRKLPNSSLRAVAFELKLDAHDLSLVSDAGIEQMAAVEELPGGGLPLSASERQAITDAILKKAAEGRLREESAVRDILVKEISDDIAKRFSSAVFASFSDGVKMVAASSLSSVSGAGQVAIPLLIAGMIIFNTMMGSIAERKREIHVYTSLGLAPMHVGALFLAEALTYGLIGAVFGYVLGQGIGTLMQHLGWLGGITLNYSGSSAMSTLGIILLVTLISALVPARIASKIAAPSIDRSWRVPSPKDGRIVAQLPFTINRTAADGALAYLAEYFNSHRDGAIGKFSAGNVEPQTQLDAAGRQCRGLGAVIWLTPFDLGIRQRLCLMIQPGQFENIYEVVVILERLSGDDASWYRMNHSFMTELRKQFLQWRSLTPQRMMEYVQQSQQLYAGRPAGNQPTEQTGALSA